MSEKTLTQAEAESRAALLTVASYDVVLDLTGLVDGPEWRATTTIAFAAAEPGAETFIQCAADIDRAELNGTSIATDNPGGRLALSGLGADNVLVVESVQRDTASRNAVHRAVDPADGAVYVWTSFEPDGAPRAWACFDQPDLKAPHRFTVTAPADWTVTTNTAPEAIDDLGDGSRVWRFPPTPPLSTYVPVVNAGPFYELRRDAGGFDLGLFCRRSLAQFLDRDADELFDLTAAGLTYFGEQFDLPFPQRRYDQVFVPEMGGAMENYGCVTWSDWFMFRHEPTYAEREIRAVVLLHEMAHMWFGDMVTMRWWNDLWLNEAFADWAAYWATAAATPFRDAWAAFIVDREIHGYMADAGPISHPIRQDAPDVAAAAAGFDMITYAKGAAVLRQLAAYVGEDVFVRGLRAYFVDHAWGNATLADLVAAVERAADRDLSRWVQGWLDTAGTDGLELQRDGVTVEVVAVGPGGGEARPHRVGVGAYAGDESGLERRTFETVEVDRGRAAVPFELQPDDVVLVNDEDLTFAAVLPDDASLDALLHSASALPTAMARTLAVLTAWQLLFATKLPTRRFLECVSGVVEVETTESVIEPILDLAAQAALLWSGPAERAEAAALVAGTARRVAERGGALRPGALRALAQTATSDQDFAVLDAAGAEEPDLAWRALVRRAALGSLDEGAVERVAAADPDPDVWVRSLLVTAATGTTAAKDEVWDAVSQHRVPAGMTGGLGRAFWQPGQEDVLAPYAERFLATLPELGEHGMIEALSVPSAMFPSVGVDAEFLRRAETVVADGVHPIVARVVLERADQVRRMLAARG